MKYNFYNDYSEGAHPNILKKLAETNLSQETGYCEDSLSLQAAINLKSILKSDDIDIHFVSGGTQANLLAIASMLKPYESVISANSGHINTHEAGSIEATGHKVESIDVADGKLKPELLVDIIELHQDEHMTKPRVVFISNSTEVGTIYSKAELKNLSKFCRKNNLYLYLDGARIGSALTAENNDLTLSDICSLTDIFYIGGTKNGALLGEAIVIVNKDLQKEFRRHLKQRGALLAKGRIVGVQFLELFKNNLFFDLARNANDTAGLLSNGIAKFGYKFLTDSNTNQVFPIFPNSVIDKLSKDYGFYIWSKVDENHSSIRLVTSWATKKEAVKIFLADLGSIKYS